MPILRDDSVLFSLLLFLLLFVLLYLIEPYFVKRFFSSRSVLWDTPNAYTDIRYTKIFFNTGSRFFHYFFCHIFFAVSLFRFICVCRDVIEYKYLSSIDQQTNQHSISVPFVFPCVPSPSLAIRCLRLSLISPNLV